MTGPNAEIADLAEASKPAPPYYVRALALGIPAYLIGIHLWTWVFMLPTFLGGRADFRRLYTSGYMVRTGYAHQLYDTRVRYYFENKLVSPGGLALPFDHPAYEALLFAPFSILSYRAAYFAFLSFNAALLGITFWLLRPYMESLRRVYAWLPAAMFLAFLPICAALIQGQDSILLLMLLAAAQRFLGQKRDFAAGSLVALGLFKFQIVIPIAVLFLVWKRWRFVTGFASAGSVAACVSILLVGFSQTAVYVQSLMSISMHLVSSVDQVNYGLQPTAMPNVRGLLFGLLNGHLPNFWVQLSIVVFSCALLAWVANAGGHKKEAELLLIAITASALVSYHLLIHDMAVLLIPALMTMNRFVGAEGSGTEDELFKFRAAALMFTTPVLMSWFPAHFYLAAVPMLLFLLELSKAGNALDSELVKPVLAAGS